MTELEEMVAGYVECALWTSIDWPQDQETEPTENLDANYSTEDLSPELLKSVRADCEAFMEANATDLEGMDPEQAGHDFWLTRNGHGVGFWDRGLGELGDRLADAARVYGEENWWIGIDGKLYS